MKFNYSRLHLEHRVFFIHFLEFVDEGQPTFFVTIQLCKMWNHIKPAIKAHDEEAMSERSVLLDTITTLEAQICLQEAEFENHIK